MAQRLSCLVAQVCAAGDLCGPTSVKLVRTVVSDDLRQRVVEVGGQSVLGGDGVLAGADADRAVAAGGADEVFDRPSGAVFDQAADGESGEDDGEVGVDAPHHQHADQADNQTKYGAV